MHEVCKNSNKYAGKYITLYENSKIARMFAKCSKMLEMIKRKKNIHSTSMNIHNKISQCHKNTVFP